MHEPKRARKKIVAIVGGRRASEAVLEAAEGIGCALVDADYRVATGGMSGVMEAASKGARASTNWSDGMVLGVLPGLDPGDANPYVDIAIPSGLNIARNVVLVALADVVVAIAGGAGTLSEMALAWQHRKPGVALDLGEGWSAKLAGLVLDERGDQPIAACTSVAEVVAAVEACQPAPVPRFAWS